MFGKLGWSAIPWTQPIPLITGAVLVVVIGSLLGLITYRKWWPYLWNEWVISVDHKRIGIMYIILGLVMLIRGCSRRSPRSAFRRRRGPSRRIAVMPDGKSRPRGGITRCLAN